MKTTLVINDETLALAISNIKDFAKKNEPFNVIIKPVADKRTSKQLRYYWLVIHKIQQFLNENGNNLNEDQVSDIMKSKFHYDVAIMPTGEKRKVLKSISDKSETDKKEMADFITKIIAECTQEWDIDIPDCDSDYNF